MIYYTLFPLLTANGARKDWFLTLGKDVMFLVARGAHGAWVAYQPGRLVASAGSRGKVVSAVLQAYAHDGDL